MHRFRLPLIVLMLGLAAVLLWVAGSYVRASETRPRPASIADAATTFSASRNGFPFINHAAAPKNTLVAKLLPGICGGMSYAAIDFYRARAAVPVNGADRFILLRNASSLVGNATMFLIWTLAPDTAENGRGPALSTSVRNVQIPELSRRLESGPVPLGLVKARNLSGMAKNHQVVAYALHVSGHLVTVRIYDPNHPGCDDTILSIDMASSDRATQYCRGKAVDSWRGFFLEDYLPVRPPS